MRVGLILCGLGDAQECGGLAHNGHSDRHENDDAPHAHRGEPRRLRQHQRFENDPQNEAEKVARMHEQPSQA